MLEKVERYLQLINELDLKLVKAVDTHLHADHITGLGALRDRTQCITVMGDRSNVDVVSMRVSDGDRLKIEGLALDVLYTPGHTDDSYSFRMADRVFTGDTLLIRGTGRTDFQNGDPRAQYDLIFNKLLRLPDETLVFPAHDYKGETVSSIGEEKAFNPRLKVKSVDEHVELMDNLNLPNPKMMDVAVPANMRVGYAQEAIAQRGWAVTAVEAMTLVDRPEIALVDLREIEEREKHGIIPGSLHAPYTDLAALCGAGACCTSLPWRPASACCSIARSVNARQWPCRRPKTLDFPPPATFRAESTHGRRLTDLWPTNANTRRPGLRFGVVLLRGGSGPSGYRGVTEEFGTCIHSCLRRSVVR